MVKIINLYNETLQDEYYHKLDTSQSRTLFLGTERALRIDNMPNLSNLEKLDTFFFLFLGKNFSNFLKVILKKKKLREIYLAGFL